jgi:hypothetical protein
MKAKILLSTMCFFLLFGSFQGTAAAQDSIYSAAGDVALVSKYIWRGQRLTNDWSVQPSMTIGIEGFAFNAWGTMDMTAVNPANGHPIQPGSGLQGKFTEIDYTFSYDYSFENVSVGTGVIFYTFPGRANSVDALATTAEIYGSISADNVPLAPSFTLYMDVDETSAGGGSPGLYFNIAAGHSVGFNHDVFTGLDLGASIAFANGGFTEFYYGPSAGGVHDASLSVGLPIAINDNWSAGAFVQYSALLGATIRGSQYGDPRVTSPTGGADTVWGGFTLSLSF